MALRWWETVDIVESLANVTRQKATQVFGNIESRINQMEEADIANQKAQRQARAEAIQCAMKSQRRAKAQVSIEEANKKLGALGCQNCLDSISSENLDRELSSNFQWAGSMVRQYKAESKQAREKAVLDEAEEWAKYNARQVKITWSDLSPDEQRDKINEEYTRLLGQYFPEEYPSYVAEGITSSSPQLTEQDRVAIQNVLNTTFSNVTGDFSTWAQDNQDEFIKRIQEGGQTPDKTVFLKQLLPEASENEIKSLFITDEQVVQAVSDLDNLFSTSISGARNGTLTPQQVSAFSLARDAIARTFVATGLKREGYPNVAYNIESGWLNEFGPELKKQLAYAYLVDPYKGNEFASLMADLGQIPANAGGTLANLLVAPVTIIGTPFAKKSVGEPVSAQEWVTAGAMLALLIAEPLGGAIGGIGGRAMTTGLRTFGAGVFTADTVIDWDKMSTGQRIFMVAMDVLLVAGVVSGVKTELSPATSVKDVFNKYLKGQDAKTASVAIDDIVAGIRKKNPNTIQLGITRLETVIGMLPDDIRARVEKRLTLMSNGIPDIIKMGDLVKPQDTSRIDNAIKSSELVAQTGKTELVDGLIGDLKARIESKQGNTEGLSARVLKLHNADEGSTVHPTLGSLKGKSYYSVSALPERTQIIKGQKLTQAQLDAYIQKNQDVLQDPRYSIGTWLNKAKNQIELDIVITVKDKARALDIGSQYGQQAIYDLKNGIELPVTKRQNLTITHYSTRVEGDVVSPKNMGEQMAGEEARTLTEYGEYYGEGLLAKRSYWYMKGQKPEARFTSLRPKTTTEPLRILDLPNASPEVKAAFEVAKERVISNLKKKMGSNWDGFKNNARAETELEYATAKYMGYDGVKTATGIAIFRDIKVSTAKVSGGRPSVETTAMTGEGTITGEVPEGVVTVTGLEPIKAIRKLSSSWKEKRLSYDETKAQLVDYVKKNLPLEVRGKMLSAVKNVKTELGLSRAIAQVDRYAEQSTQQAFRTQITKELSNIKPTRQKGILKGKFTADVQEWLDAVRHNLNINRERAVEQIAKNVEDFNNGLLEYDAMLKQNEILNMAGIKGMASEELATVLEAIRTVKQGGRTAIMQAREAWKANIKAAREDVVTEVTGGKGIIGGVEAGAKEALPRPPRLKGWVERIENSQHSIMELGDKLTKLTKKKFTETKLRELLVKNVYRAREVENTNILRITEEIKSKFTQIFGVTRQHDVNTIIRRMAKDKINLGTFKDAQGNSVTLELTKGQIIKKYQELLDPTLERTFTEGMKWTDEIKNAIIKSLTPDERAWADYQMEVYQKYYDVINTTYRELYGVDLPRNANYSPISRDFKIDIPEDQLVYKDLMRYSSTLNGALKARIANLRPLKFTDANTTFMNHFVQMEHFRAWTQPMRELRSVLSSQIVRRAITQYHGSDILRQIDIQLNRIAMMGIDTAHIVGEMDALRGNFSKAVIGLKPYQMLQQLPTVFAPLVDMSFPDLMRGVVDFWKNPIKNYRWMMENSSYIKSRYTQGFERDIRLARHMGGFQGFIGGKFSTDAAYFLMQMGDKFGVMQSWWARYQAGLRAKLPATRAMEEAGLLMDRVQNTASIDTLSNIQTGGTFWKLLTMFQSQPNKYFRVIASNLRNIRYGRGSRAKAISNIALAWVVLPSLFQLIADGFQWKKDRQLTALALGPINDLLVIGQISQTIGDWIIGENFEYQPTPIMSPIRDIGTFIQKTRSLINKGQDPYEDITTEDVIGLLEALAKPVGEISGIPTPYMVQLERAIRSGDPRQMLFSQWALEGGTKVDRDGISQYLYGKKYNQLTPNEQARIRELVG